MTSSQCVHLSACVAVFHFATAACAPPSSLSRSANVLLADTLLFAAAVQAIASTPLRVDPRPFTYGWFAKAEDLASVAPEVIAQRTRILERLGIGTTDALADAKCHGLVPPPHSPLGCPATGMYYSAILGVPEQTSEGVVVRSYQRTMTPGGAADSMWEYLFRRDGRDGWAIVRRVNLFVT